MRPRRLLLPLILAAACAVPAAADAAVTAQVTVLEGQTVALLAGDDAANTVVVNAGRNGATPYVDFGADGLVDAGGCPGGHCENPAIVAAILVLGGGDDKLSSNLNDVGLPIGADGGAGADTLIGSTGPDELQGGDGNDWIEASNGADTVDGGPGDDRLYGESSTINVTPDGAADVLSGGSGNDTAGYAPRGQYGGVTVSLDGVANDGVPGENDNVDAEGVIGTVFDDTLTGGPGPDRLDGDKGNDTIAGLAGNDTVLGGDGSDTLNGGDGADTVTGGFGEDRIDGGPGADTLQGDTLERNVVAIGNDVIEARDGTADSVDCGIGADVAHVDGVDVLAADPGGLCESVDRAGATGAGGSGPAGKVAARLRGGASRRRGVRLAVTLPAAARVTIRFERKQGRRFRTVGRVRERLAAGTTTIRIRKVGGRKLKPGRWRIRVSAPGLTTKTVKFKVRRR